MRSIFDPGNMWLGSSSPFVPLQSNKRPLAVDDVLNVVQGSGPVSVPVLANDFDPEGAPLTLVSASAALGTAVAEADNTVTYTPPPGITGFDTVLYEIADNFDQRQFGQINVSIIAPALTIDLLADNTLTVNASTGAIDITITEPAAFAGSYQIQVDDVLGGPVPLAPPSVVGTMAVGNVLSASPGLWVHDSGVGTPVTSWQWRRAGIDIAGATGVDYTVVTGDPAQGISVREMQTDGHGQRFAESAVVSVPGSGFLPSDDALLVGWWDAADALTLTQSGGAVSDWADKAGGAALTHGVVGQQPATGARTLNGRNILDFNGTQLLAATRSLPASGDVAFHMALVIDTIDNVFDTVISVDAANDFQFDSASSTAFSGRLNATGIGASVNLTGGPFVGALILSLVFNRTGSGQFEVFVGGVSRGAGAYTAPLGASQMLRLMGNRAGNIALDGAVAELIVTGDVSNRAAHHAYLATKWGLV